MNTYNIDPERRDPSPLWAALDYVVNAGLVDGDTPEERMRSAIVETEYEVLGSGTDYGSFTSEQIREYIAAHYTP